MDIESIHFIGIGGIGISGLARYMQSQGVHISGSDIAISSSTKYLQSLGVKVSIPHNKNNITNPSLVVHSAIIKPNNVEIIEARNRNIPILSRSEALKLILKQKRVFSICGAHGKSSTTAMLSAILNNCGAIIGAESKEFYSNVRTKQSETLVFEADESDGSFLNSNPYCAIVTNAEPEHMEYYDYDLSLFQKAYSDFLEKAKIAVINAEDDFLSTLNLPSIRLYPSRDIRNISFHLVNDEPTSRFDLFNENKFIGNFEVWGFGDHTVSNASLAILSALNELETEKIQLNLRNYKGIKKRFDILHKDENCVIIDDYGHHPTEIDKTMDSLMQYAALKNINEIYVIWQPHKYSRTINNIHAFVECFKHKINKLIILPVWGAGEEHVDINFDKYFGIYNFIYAHRINRYENGIELIRDEKIIQNINSGLIIGFGAGDITYQLRGKI